MTTLIAPGATISGSEATLNRLELIGLDGSKVTVELEDNDIFLRFTNTLGRVKNQIRLTDGATQANMEFEASDGDAVDLLWDEFGIYLTKKDDVGLTRANVWIEDNSVTIATNDNAVNMTLGAAGITVTGLPTADPVAAGGLWIDTAAGRVLKVSAGP